MLWGNENGVVQVPVDVLSDLSDEFFLKSIEIGTIYEICNNEAKINWITSQSF